MKDKNVYSIRSFKKIVPTCTYDLTPKNEANGILAISELAYPGDTVKFSFSVPPPGPYPYIYTYSAHWTQMQGRLISTKQNL